MTIAIRNFNGIHTPIQRIQENSNLRMLMVICAMITAPSLLLVVFLSGWVQYVFATVIAINVAVPVLAYFASLNPPRSLVEEEYPFSRAPQLTFEEVTLPMSERQVPAEKVSDKV